MTRTEKLLDDILNIDLKTEPKDMRSISVSLLKTLLGKTDSEKRASQREKIVRA
ncbi:hypothetical protein KKD03_02060 [Patescibacteria group bacterium]|nr:hypothetical protein [Patescibacteria group bacterium]